MRIAAQPSNPNSRVVTITFNVLYKKYSTSMYLGVKWTAPEEEEYAFKACAKSQYIYFRNIYFHLWLKWEENQSYMMLGKTNHQNCLIGFEPPPFFGQSPKQNCFFGLLLYSVSPTRIPILLKKDQGILPFIIWPFLTFLGNLS